MYSLLFLSLVVAITNASMFISVDQSDGIDSPLCLEGLNTSCKSLDYVFEDNIANEILVQLHGDYHLNETIEINAVEGLAIQSNYHYSVIHCEVASDAVNEGAGFKMVNVVNITMSNIVFEGCGTLQVSTTLRNGRNVPYRSAVYILNSTDVFMEKVEFKNNLGRALSLFDVGGFVKIMNCRFSGNKVPHDELEKYFGGGGIAIEFTHCTPGEAECDQFHNEHSQNNDLVISECVFANNRATNDEIVAQIHTVQFRKLTGSDGNNAGQGGGIHVTFKGPAANNSLLIEDCVFHQNSAKFGGGIDVVIQDNSRQNRVTINRCEFTENSATERSGGAMNIGYTSGRTVLHNTISIRDTQFFKNSAGWGGAVSFFASRVKTPSTNKLEFINCTWIENSASIGAAVSLRPTAGSSLFDGDPPTPLIQGSLFSKNIVLTSARFLTSANDKTTKQELETGALHIKSISVNLSDTVLFTENIGSAIVATSSLVNVLRNTKISFVRNHATYGGAIGLLGFSILELYSGSEVIFDSNEATELGGAVYATASHQAEFVFSHKCFFSYELYFHPDYWNTSITFTNNTARFGHNIFTDSLLPCAKNVYDVETNVSSALLWRPFHYSGESRNSSIATSPATIDFTLPDEIAPGEPIFINSKSRDDLQQAIPAAYQIFLNPIRGNATASPFIADGNFLVIDGYPGSEFLLTLRTQNTRYVSNTKPGRLGDCPLGLTLHHNNTITCTCSHLFEDKRLYGIAECIIEISYRVYIWKDHWIGCTGNNTVITGSCPLGYCHSQSVGELKVRVPRTCNSSNEHFPCASNRKGILCGECKPGYTAHYHSNTFVCKECRYGAIGLLIYVTSEIIPVIILFGIILLMKIRLTSGPLQTLILFAQVTTLTTSPTMNRVQYISLRIHSSILGIFSLEFLKMDELSYCLWKGATVLSNLLFRYLTTFFSFLLIFTYIMVIRHNHRFTKFLICKPVKKAMEKMSVFKNEIVHGMSTFMLLTYTQYTLVSFQILARLQLYGEGYKTVGSVVRFQGSVEYFGPEHLPYAIPAVLVLIFLSLPPPLLLLSYPLCWKIKARLRPNGSDKTIWLIRKLLPLIDSFQGVFKDNCRMFAGLLFLWRIILIAISALSTSLWNYYITNTVTLLILFTIHAVVRPYKRQVFNVIDSLLFADMAVVNIISWYALYNSSNLAEILISFQLLLMYIPIICFAVVGLLFYLKKRGVLSEKCLPQLLMKWVKRPPKTVDPLPKINKTSTKCEDGDEDLFSRAADLNHPPLVLTRSETGFQLLSQENTQTTEVIG